MWIKAGGTLPSLDEGLLGGIGRHLPIVEDAHRNRVHGTAIRRVEVSNSLLVSGPEPGQQVLVHRGIVPELRGREPIARSDRIGGC